MRHRIAKSDFFGCSARSLVCKGVFPMYSHDVCVLCMCVLCVYLLILEHRRNTTLIDTIHLKTHAHRGAASESQTDIIPYIHSTFVIVLCSCVCVLPHS